MNGVCTTYVLPVGLDSVIVLRSPLMDGFFATLSSSTSPIDGALLAPLLTPYQSHSKRTAIAVVGTGCELDYSQHLEENCEEGNKGEESAYLT